MNISVLIFVQKIKLGVYFIFSLNITSKHKTHIIGNIIKMVINIYIQTYIVPYSLTNKTKKITTIKIKIPRPGIYPIVLVKAYIQNVCWNL